MQKKAYKFLAYFGLIISLAILLLIASPRIYGGVSVEQSKLPLAYIYTTDGMSCSGMLVSPKQVLTAAHCTPKFSGRSAATYKVNINNQTYSVKSFAAHPEYKFQLAVTADNAKYDIGLLELSADVTTIKAIPILLEQNLKVGDKFITYAFGNNENQIYGKKPAQFATFLISELLDGLFISKYSSSQAGICSGDSGGVGVIANQFRTAAVSLVSSSVNNSNRQGVCNLGVDGESVFVDLQSRFAQDFLFTQSGITFISANNIIIEELAFKIYQEIDACRYLKSSQQIRQIINKAKLNLSQQLKISDPKRKKILHKINLKLSEISKEKKIFVVKNKLRKVQNDLKKLLIINN